MERLFDWIPAPAPDPDPGFAGMTNAKRFRDNLRLNRDA